MSEKSGFALAPVAKLGFTEVKTRDVGSLCAHYVDVLCFEEVGRAGSTVFLNAGPDDHCLVVAEGEPDARASVGYQLQGELGGLEDSLRDLGLTVERRSDPQPGIAEAIVFEEPGTGVAIVLYPEMAPTGIAMRLGPRPTKLGHVAAFVTDVPAIQKFYEEVLGFRFSDSLSDWFVFLRCNSDHHTANFLESTKLTGHHHTAYEARDFVHLKEMLDHLAIHDVRLEWGVGRHGIGHNIFTYHRDPDGNFVELFTEIDVIHDEAEGHWEPRPWHEECPMGPKVWEQVPATANQWGPLSPVVMDR